MNNAQSVLADANLPPMPGVTPHRLSAATVALAIAHLRRRLTGAAEKSTHAAACSFYTAATPERPTP